VPNNGDFDLDAIRAVDFPFVVVGEVPEPASCVAWGLLALGGCVWRRRRLAG
jgi:hypothetical protein